LANQGQQVVDIYHIPSGRSTNFMAMMTEFSDTYTSEWNSETAYGRMDPIQTFQRTGRVITLGFDMAAGSSEEAHDNLQRITMLAQMLYPTYDADGLIKNSPFCKIKFMNWAASTKDVAGGGGRSAKDNGLLGTINGFTFSPVLDAGVFTAKESRDYIFPKIVNISFSFTVIHEHQLGWIGKTVSSQDFPYGVNPGSYTEGSGKGTGQFKKRTTLIQRDAGIAWDAKMTALENRMTGGRKLGKSEQQQIERAQEAVDKAKFEDDQNAWAQKEGERMAAEHHAAETAALAGVKNTKHASGRHKALRKSKARREFDKLGDLGGNF